MLGVYPRLIEAIPERLRRALSGGSVLQRIFGAMLTVGSFSILVKLAATVKDAAVARQFGVSDGMDAFGIAFIIPSAAIAIVAGSLNNALIPTYVQVREREGKAAACRLLGSVITVSIGLLAGVAALLAIAAPVLLPLLGSSFSPHKLALTRGLMLLLLPTLITTGLGAICSAVLTASDQFALAAVTPASTPLLILGAVLSLSWKFGVYTLAIGLLAGSIIELALLGWGLSRQGISIIPRWPQWDPATREVFRQCVSLTAGWVLVTGSMLVDQAIAASAAPGSVASLNYGAKVIAALNGIGANAVGVAVLPHFARLAAREDWQGIRRVLRFYIKLLAMITIPATLIFCATSEPLVRLLFQRGAFTHHDTQMVTAIQRMFLLQIPFYTIGILFVRAISALNANYLLAWFSILNLALNVVLDLAFLRWFGVPGIALSTSAVYAMSTSCLFLMLMRILKRHETSNVVPRAGEVIPAFAAPEASR